MNVACLIIENTTAFIQDSLQNANYKPENLHIQFTLVSLFQFSQHALINREAGNEVSLKVKWNEILSDIKSLASDSVEIK